MKNRYLKTMSAAIALLALAGCASMTSVPDYQAIVASPDRSDADRLNDKRRNAVELLKFYDLRPGMVAADLGATAGYNTELLARSVGASGRVYAQNVAAFATRINDRLKTPAMQNVVAVARDFDDPLPPEARNLDAVVLNFFYHDTVNMAVDRMKMNRAVFAALKSGGVYIIADHSARAGTGAGETKTLHRIEEAFLRKEVEAAGFRLIAEGSFLRNPQDPRTAPSGKNSVPNDEFVLKFAKP